MEIENFERKIESKQYMTYHSDFNKFWQWKMHVELKDGEHILDDNHIEEASAQLLDILPSWQTWRGVNCDYRRRLPIALSNIAEDYNSIRSFDLTQFDKVPNQSLAHIWHELGQVKTDDGQERQIGDYLVIAICKPLMLLWGQTPGYDKENRDNMDGVLDRRMILQEWLDALGHERKQLMHNPQIIQYCINLTKKLYGDTKIIPYGRFLDIYYY